MRFAYPMQFAIDKDSNGRYIYPIIHVNSWSLALQVLEFVPLKKLNRLSLCLTGPIRDIHDLDWHSLTEWLLNVPYLWTVEIHLEQSYAQQMCLVYEMRGFERVFTPNHVRGPILRGSVGRQWGPAQERTCQHDGCCMYAEQHLSAVA